MALLNLPTIQVICDGAWCFNSEFWLAVEDSKTLSFPSNISRHRLHVAKSHSPMKNSFHSSSPWIFKFQKNQSLGSAYIPHAWYNRFGRDWQEDRTRPQFRIVKMVFWFKEFIKIQNQAGPVLNNRAGIFKVAPALHVNVWWWLHFIMALIPSSNNQNALNEHDVLLLFVFVLFYGRNTQTTN